jgi:hypothetical protein
MRTAYLLGLTSFAPDIRYLIFLPPAKRLYPYFGFHLAQVEEYGKQKGYDVKAARAAGVTDEQIMTEMFGKGWGAAKGRQSGDYHISHHATGYCTSRTGRSRAMKS